MPASLSRIALLVSLLLPLVSAHGQATGPAAGWKIEMRQVRLPVANEDCGPIELVVRDGSGNPPVSPDGKQISWHDFDFTLTEGAGAFRLTGSGNILCASSPGATGVVTVRYPENTYLSSPNGKGRSGKQLIAGATAMATLQVRSAGTAPPAVTTSLPPPPVVTGTATGLPPPPVTAATGTSQAGPTLAPPPVPVGTTGTPQTVVQPAPATSVFPTGTVPPMNDVSLSSSRPPPGAIQTTQPDPAPACTTPIASITDITGMEINDTGTQVIVSWPPIPCQPVVYKVTRSADRGGRIEQIELATPIAVTSLATRTTSMRAVDQPVSTGLFQANYQVEATLPDGRAVSSAWRMWIAGGSSGAMTETTSSGPRLQVDGEPGTTPRPPGLADSLAQASPQLWDLWLAPAGGAALVYWRGVLAATDCIVTWSDPRPGGRAFRFPVSCGNKVSDAGSEGFWAGNLPVTDATSLVLRVEARFADGTLRFAEETVTADQPPFYRFLLSRPSATELRACAGLPRSIWDQRLVFKFNSAGGVDQQESDYWLFGVSGSLANDPVKYPMKAWWPHHRIWGTGLPAEGKRLSFSVEDVFSTNGAAWCLTWSYPYRIDEKITLASAPTDSSGVPTVPFTRRWVTEWVILEPTEDDLTDIRPVSSSYSGAGLP